MLNKHTLDVEKLTTLEAFDALFQDPQAGVALQTDNIFLTPLWLRQWWLTYGADFTLHVLVVREQGQLLGALPLTLHRTKLGLRTLSFMGAGELTPDYLDVLSAPERLEEVIQALTAYLLEHAPEWDVLDLDRLPAESPLQNAFPSLFRSHRYRIDSTVSAHCYYIHLPPSCDEYLATLDKPVYRNLQRRRRNLQCDYPGLVFTRVENEEQLEAAFAALVKFHQVRWTAKGYPGSFSSQRFTEFHQQVTRQALKADSLRLFSLHCGDAIIGVCYCYQVKDVLQGYQYSYDETWATYSIGSFMIWQMIEYAIEDGVRIFDFLEGDEKYKDDWATSVRANLRLKLFRPTLRGGLAYFFSRHAGFAMELGIRIFPEKQRREVRKRYLRWQASRQAKKG